MAIWLIPVAIGAALTALGCGRIGYSEGGSTSGLVGDAGQDGGVTDGGAEAGPDRYLSDNSPARAMQRLTTGDTGK